MARVVMSRINSVAMSPLVSTTYDRRNQIYIRHSFSRFWQLWVYWYNITYSTHQYTCYSFTSGFTTPFCARYSPSPRPKPEDLLIAVLKKTLPLTAWPAGPALLWPWCWIESEGPLWWQSDASSGVPLCTARKDWKSMPNWYNTIPCYWLITYYCNILQYIAFYYIFL